LHPRLTTIRPVIAITSTADTSTAIVTTTTSTDDITDPGDGNAAHLGQSPLSPLSIGWRDTHAQLVVIAGRGGQRDGIQTLARRDLHYAGLQRQVVELNA
jgi:hypothetical protein